MKDYRHIIDMLLEDETELAEETVLLESESEEILSSLGGEVTLMNYLLRFEEYLDDHDMYAFDGWSETDKIKILGRPEIEKFWITVYATMPPNTDLKAIERITNDQEAQNKVDYKKLAKNAGYVFRFKILKRYLDELEKANIERAQQLADEKEES